MKPRRIIDVHQHVSVKSPADYVKELAAQAARHNVRKAIVLGLEWEGRTIPGSNNDTLQAWKMEPDLVVPFACIDPDWPIDPSRVDSLRESGFVGLKFIRPKHAYSDEIHYPWYERAQKLTMPCLFHLGIVARLPEWEGKRTDSNLMRPIHLDTVARSFPSLDIIGAHMGNPWFEEAAMSCRWNPNLCFDLSGSSLKRKKPQEIGELLWWGSDTYPAYRDKLGRSAWEKICFGTDVDPSDIPDVLGDYTRLGKTLKLSATLLDAMFYRNAARILSRAGVLDMGDTGLEPVTPTMSR